MLILGIETSCDETSAAIVEETGQADAEKRGASDPFGELAPELALTCDDGDSLHTLRRE